MRREAGAKARISRLEPPQGYDEAGLTGAARSLYARLAAEGPLPADGLDADALHALLALELALETDAGVDAVAPTRPLGAVAERHTRAVVSAHDAIDDLSALWLTSRARNSELQILSGAAAGRAYQRSFPTVSREILALSIGPRNGQQIEPAPGVLDALSRGVGVRVVYHSGVFTSPDAIAVTEACMAAGEQARVLPSVPINLTILDDVAFMNVSYDTDEPMHLAVTHNRRLVDSWCSVFEAFWRLAMPLDLRLPAARESPDDLHQLVRLLSLGLTDRAIARELGVSERTVGRRVTRLQEHVGAETRFQLGLQIASQGWV